MKHPADRAISTVAPLVSGMGPPLVVAALAARRRRHVTDVVARFRPAADAAGARILDGDPRGQADLAHVADEALADLRARSLAESSPLPRALAWLDSRWHAPEKAELLDDPQLDPALRTRIMAQLDHVNVTLGNYRAFLDAIVPLCRADGPTTILDLAAGHGGFAIAATELAAQRGLDLRFTATDLKQEYLDMGAAEAARRGVSVQFAVQDALDLRNLDPGSFDVVISTQSLHHFPAGLVAVMFRAAATAAGRGVVFVDGCRSALTGLGLAAWGLAHDRDWRVFSHDAWTSCRRFFVPAELEVLCRLGSWGEDADVRWMPPGHLCARLTRSGAVD